MADVSVYCETLFLFKYHNSINPHLTHLCVLFRPDVLHFSERKQHKTEATSNLMTIVVEIPLFLK